MNSRITTEEINLLKLLKMSLISEGSEDEAVSYDYESLLAMARKHSVLSLMYDKVVSSKGLPEHIKKDIEAVSVRTVRQSYRLAFLSKALVDLFNENGIDALVLKGCCIAAYYPVPELRKSGDVDLLINPDDLKLACKLLETNGFVVNEEQHANHHIGFQSPDQIEVELHTMLTEPFDNVGINKYLEKMVGKITELRVEKDVMGISVPTLKEGYFVYQLLLHMLQHFLRSGFGLKLLSDWVVFWNHQISEETKSDYISLVSESGLKGFSDMVTAVCIYTLGLRKEQVSFMFKGENIPTEEKAEQFIYEILEAGEFGKSSKDRMVVMRGTGFFDYFREFHHQMRLNFPRAGKVFVLWPILWFITLVRFLVNNRKIRNISTSAIFKKAHARSKLMEDIKLFEIENDL